MQRDKGRVAEAEVAAIWRRLGFEVRGLEGRGDHLVVGRGLTIHSEVKRQEVLRLPLWARQASAEAPRGALPVLAYRRNREEWKAATPAKVIPGLLEPLGWAAGIHYSLRDLNGEWWALMELEQLAAGLAGARAAAEAS